jgi:arginase family enzyme
MIALPSHACPTILLARLMQKIKWLGVPFHYGQGNKGVAAASLFLRGIGFIQELEKVATVEDLGDMSFTLMAEKDSSIRFEQTVAFACEHISTTVAKAFSDDLLLIVGGDHGLSLGSIHGILSKNPETIVVWVDAHGDMNPPTASPTFQPPPPARQRSTPQAPRRPAAAHESFEARPPADQRPGAASPAPAWRTRDTRT